ncbi:unnamed protein product [Calicophoron daubneyi]|uniref:B-related factor 1 n=2 Tax=Calicophoron daubneyi TaxID=300641 RepID=A0AAV2TIP8_CALDB
MRCTHCGGTNFDEDRARADLVCLDCGMVLSENAMSSEVEFVDAGAGVTTAVGRFVSDESQFAVHESRQVTENKARRRIQTICGQLRLSNDVSLSAFRYYQSALFRGITRGRGSAQVAAGCIYLAARQLRVNLMLLDLSDAVGINVYVLGRCYTELKRRLHLVIPEMDPCIYIDRFASQLEFGDKMSMVATTAMRLLQRMKKDWLTTGRRPSGLAAAALLVAARIHEFNRTEEDVARIARISQQTARKRLEEFSRTPTSALSIEAFFTVDYEEEQDPPAFEASKEETVKELDEKAFSRISDEIKELERRIDEELQTISEKRTSRGFKGRLGSLDVGQSKGLQHLLCDSSEQTASPSSICETSTNDEDAPTASENDGQKSCTPTRDVLREVLDGVVEPDLLDSCVEDLHILTEHSGDKMCELLNEAEQARVLSETNAEEKVLSGDSKTSDNIESSGASAAAKDSKSLKLPLFIPSVSLPKPEFPSAADGTLQLDGIDDEELDHEYILHPREVMIKAAIWYKANAEYLQECRRKRAAKLKQMEERAKNPPKKRARKQPGQRRPRFKPKNDPFNKFEPVEEETMEKPFSSKINYEALEAIVGAPNPTPLPEPSTSKNLEPGPLLAATLNADSTPHDAGVISPRRLEVTRGDKSAKPTDTSQTIIIDGEEPNETPEGDEEMEDEAGEDVYQDDEDDTNWQNGDELW